jgi:hypothetical protein
MLSRTPKSLFPTCILAAAYRPLGLVVVGAQPRLFVGTRKAGQATITPVADPVTPEVLPRLPEADVVRAALVGRILELDIVIVPDADGACLEMCPAAVSRKVC